MSGPNRRVTLSTLPSIGTCLLGVFAGLLLTEPDDRGPAQGAIPNVFWHRGGGARLAVEPPVPDDQTSLDLILCPCSRGSTARFCLVLFT